MIRVVFLATMLLSLAAIALAVYAASAAPSGTMTIRKDSIAHESGQAYMSKLDFELPILYRVASDSPAAPYGSTLALSEDGEALGPAHAAHDTIRAAGKGRYSHWLGWIRFSSSDNTNPLRNDRSYTVRFTAISKIPTPWVFAVGGLLAAISGALFFVPAGTLRDLGEQARRGLPRALTVIGINVLVLLCLLPVAEIAIRLYFYGTLYLGDVEVGFMRAHPTRGWSLSPDSVQHWRNLDFSVISRTNSRGFRDREHTLEKPAGVRRIVILGDSFMEGYYVDFEESLPVLLERKLGPERHEVINLGVRGYGTTQAHLTLKEEGILYRPDVVLLFFAMNNDLSNDSKIWRDALLLKPIDPDVLPPFLTIEPDGNLVYEYPNIDENTAAINKMGQLIRQQKESRSFWEESVLYSLVELLRSASRNDTAGDIGVRPTVVLPYDPNVTYGEVVRTFNPSIAGHRFTEQEYSDMLDGAWRTTCASLAEAQRIALSAGSDFAVVTVPSMIQVDPLYQKNFTEAYPSLILDPMASSRRLAVCAGTHSFRVIDLLPDFTAKAQEDDEVLYNRYGDRHWSPRGVALATEIVYRELTGTGLVPPAKSAEGS